MRILYEDPYFLIVEKPVGVLSEQSGSGGDALSLAAAQTGGICLPVHRLDRETGGAMLIARSAAAAAGLTAEIQARRVTKEYLAAAQGAPPESRGVMRDLLFRDARKNKSYVVTRMRRGVREAVLEYETLATAQDACLLRIRLYTGRTHQIRVQLASRGMPLLGDRKYGSREDGGAALWSFRLALRHPFTGAPVEVLSLPPERPPWTLFGPIADLL